MNWVEFYMTLAKTVSEKSKDRSTKVGAVIADASHSIRAVGFNGFPRGADDTVDERHERPAKYAWTEHAERNAIYNAASMGVSLKGCEIYISGLPPCIDCARGIIQSGITAVYFYNCSDNSRWSEECRKARYMLMECGVEVHILPPSGDST